MNKEFDEFNLESFNFGNRTPEKSEIFSEDEALTYIDKCDYPESADDLLLAWEIAHQFTNIGEMSILDAMCGPGRLGRELLNLGAQSATFHDGHKTMLNHAQKEALDSVRQNQDTKSVLSQVNKIPLPNGSFDLVVCHNSTHQLSSVERLRDTIKEFLRLVKPGGFVFIADYQRNFSKEFIKALEERLRHTDPDIVPLLVPTFTAAFSKEEFESAISLQSDAQRWSITDAQQPNLTRNMRQRVNLDRNTGHLMDFSPISLRVIIQKKNI